MRAAGGRPGYRIYYSRDDETILILLAAGTKRDQNRDIRNAKDRCGAIAHDAHANSSPGRPLAKSGLSTPAIPHRRRPPLFGRTLESIAQHAYSQRRGEWRKCGEQSCRPKDCCLKDRTALYITGMRPRPWVRYKLQAGQGE